MIITKLIPRWKHYVSTAYGISDQYYGGNEKKMAGTGQGNKFSGDLCRDTSCIIIIVLEKDELGIKYRSKISEQEMMISAIAFVDDTDLVAEGKEAETMMKKML